MTFYYSNPMVVLEITAIDGFITHIDFILDGQAGKDTPNTDASLKKAICAQFDEYFRGERFEFELDYRLEGTEFQIAVWEAMLNVGYGETAAYSEIAERIKRPKATRAVGMAAHDNPIPIIVPCHRIIGKNGSLVNFGGGIELKANLLDHEKQSLLRWK